ncbi:MAG TPA: protein-L-isoaspartate(D-aspartate) O-methyltransferase [Chloroflexota bacterium]|nr:protein-L-isoaspartate(D-aspartate) O-methyltransferase [Chloroflexota bacterium]
MPSQRKTARKETAQSRLIEQLRREGAAGERVLDALARVPREVFIPLELRHRAFEDEALPIDAGQTISQPTVVAHMTEALALLPEHRVLEIGTGSGYQAAVLAELAAHVTTVERHEELAEQARRTLGYLGYDNVRVIVGDGTLGWEEGAPYDAILVTAAGPVVPGQLTEQLARGGRLVLPVGGRNDQQLVLVRKNAQGQLSESTLGYVRFVPLIGAEGWSGA